MGFTIWLFSPILVIGQTTIMKVQKSEVISAFGGMEFIFEYLKNQKFEKILGKELPVLSNQSRYQWNDIFHSLMGVFFCGGDCIEDLQVHLRDHFRSSPFFKMPSPDTVLRRLSQLSEDNIPCMTKRGAVQHIYNRNQTLEKTCINLLKHFGVFENTELTLDYDNTILFAEKSDCRTTYKRLKGYQPGVCTINEKHVLYIENRNGNSDAKAFQLDTLTRLFDLLDDQDIQQPDHFRADAASYQFEVVELLCERVKNFYIGCRNSYIQKYFSQISHWKTLKEGKSKIEVGEINITPFIRQAREANKNPREYRLVVKRTQSKSSQVDLFTQDTFEYRAILTNNTILDMETVANFYNHRGNMEKLFDVLKNDFGWDNLPFSKLQNNTVFLYFTAIINNLYNKIITVFSTKVKTLQPTDRIKRFLFRFIILPAKWVKHARSNTLRIYGETGFKT